MRIILASTLILMAAACGGGNDRSQSAPSESQAVMLAPPMPEMADAKRADADSMSGGAGSNIIQNDPGGGGGGQRLIAYEYSYGFRVPTARMEPLMKAQQAACEAAGPAQCYVVSSNISGLGQDSSSGVLQLKGSTDWVKKFQAGLTDSLKPFDAEVDSNNTSSEDLTTQIIDVTARLDAKKVSRDRLQELLKSRPGKLGDLLDIERELSNRQGEVDSMESTLAAMKLRVAMSSLTLSYTPKYSAVSESIWRPLADAFESFVPIIVESLAALIRFIAGSLLWILVLGGIGVFVWRGMRGKRAPKVKSNPGGDPTP